MKSFKNLFFVLALVSFGCNGADARLGKKSDFVRRRTQRFFPGSYMIQNPRYHALGKQRLTGEVDPAVERAAEEWKQRRIAPPEVLVRPLVFLEEDKQLTARKNAEARAEANARFGMRMAPLVSSEDDDDEVDTDEDEEQIEQLIQRFVQADIAGTIPDADYEVMQKSGFMDDQRKVLDYDKLGEFLLQKSWYE